MVSGPMAVFMILCTLWLVIVGGPWEVSVMALTTYMVLWGVSDLVRWVSGKKDF